MLARARRLCCFVLAARMHETATSASLPACNFDRDTGGESITVWPSEIVGCCRKSSRRASGGERAGALFRRPRHAETRSAAFGAEGDGSKPLGEAQRVPPFFRRGRRRMRTDP